MGERFEKLPPDRQEHLRQICIEEFSKRGYLNASTNHIIQKAGISKGILFHYFGSKKNLYLYLIQQVGESLLKRLQAELELIQAQEFFDRAKAVVLARLRVFAPYPLEYRLLYQAFTEPPLEVKRELQELHRTLYLPLCSFDTDFYSKYLNLNKLRRDTSLGQGVEMINLLLEQILLKYLRLYRLRPQELMNPPQFLLEELDTYIDLLKYGIYKEEK